jgi:hypothetical protein
VTLPPQPWIHKAVRTALATAPGLAWYIWRGDRLGVMAAFAALCFAVPYADRSWRATQLAGSAALGMVLMPLATWLHEVPVAYVIAAAAGGAAYIAAQRTKLVTPRVAIWTLIYVLYASSELRGAPDWEVLAAALLVVPTTVWVWAVCRVWPERGSEPAEHRTASGPTMSIAVHATCSGAAAALAALTTFAFGLPHPNWAIWSALTVIRPSRNEAQRRSIQRLAGMTVGASVGIAAATSLAGHPDILQAMTATAVVLMVAFEQYVLAVAVRSALAPLAAWSLHDAALAAGEARMLCILVGVAIGTAATLLFSTPRIATAIERAAARRIPIFGRR